MMTIKSSFDLLKTPKFITITASIPFLLLLFLINHHSPPPLNPPPLLATVVERMGVLDDTGAMTLDFKVGNFTSLDEEEHNGNDNDNKGSMNHSYYDGGDIVKFDKYKVCDHNDSFYYYDYVPIQCDRVLDCLLPRPTDYKLSIRWPQSRDEVWLSNLPRNNLSEYTKGKVAIKGDKYVFPDDETQEYLRRISQMIPGIALGDQIRVALDINSGIANFGASLMQFNVTTLSIANGHDNQIQFALERGVPAMLAEFSTHRLLYPSQAFDLIHCSNCRVNWTHHDGILLLEANRILRAGGYFVWVAQSVNKEKHLQDQFNVHPYNTDMEALATRICWEVVSKEGPVGIWRKPLYNTCYRNRDVIMQPPICNSTNDPDNIWSVGLTSCITLLPENGYGGNISRWPARLHDPPHRLWSINLDAYLSRKDIFRAESKYWHDIIEGYIRAFHWKEYNLRNVLDMRAGFGGFAAALFDHQIDCWVMNVVPVNEFNTLPVLYDRGLIGVMHDWCEPFNTYPRTYDLLHAAGLFSVEQKRRKCNISTIMLEMDRILRPGGRVYIRDSITVIAQVQEIVNAMGWIPALHDNGEGPHASWKILICEKRL
ncbi:hypothetical protein ACFE04_004609 [Oxalis oulophora]